MFVGVPDVTTIDYSSKEFETTGLRWAHLDQYLKDKLNKHSIYKMVSSFLNAPYTFDGEFDVVVSHLSMETISLGRFGEHLLLFWESILCQARSEKQNHFFNRQSKRSLLTMIAI